MLEIDELLLDKYLVSTYDVRKCPMKDCKNAGFLPERENQYIYCTEPFVCEACSHSWKDPL